MDFALSETGPSFKDTRFRSDSIAYIILLRIHGESLEGAKDMAPANIPVHKINE